MNVIEQALADADCLATPDQVENAIDRLAVGITSQISRSNPIVFCVMNGAMVVAGRMLCNLDPPLKLRTYTLLAMVSALTAPRSSGGTTDRGRTQSRFNLSTYCGVSA